MYICHRIGEMAEWSNAAVLKTVEGHTSGGSNPSSSAKKSFTWVKLFLFPEKWKACFAILEGLKKHHRLGDGSFSL